MKFNASQIEVSGTKENTLAKILLIATGSQINPSEMDDLLFLHESDGHFGGIATLIESYMSQKVSSNSGDIEKTVAQMMANATGDTESWTSVKAKNFIWEMSNIGVKTWTGLYAQLIENSTSLYGSQLDFNVKNYIQAYGFNPGEGQGSGTDTLKLPSEVASKFKAPQGDDYYATVGVWDMNNNLIKEFKFDAPKMLFTSTASIFDFGDGDKTLAVMTNDYESIFGFGKDAFLINFSKGDKIVFIDGSKYYQIGQMSEGPLKFDNELKNFDEGYKDPYDPIDGIFDEGDSFVAIHTARQWYGDLLSFPVKGVPVELSSIGDKYMQYVEGITYNLNLTGDDTRYDGTVIIVGSNPTLLNSENFIFNDPEFIV